MEEAYKIINLVKKLNELLFIGCQIMTGKPLPTGTFQKFKKDLKQILEIHEKLLLSKNISIKELKNLMDLVSEIHLKKFKDNKGYSLEIASNDNNKNLIGVLTMWISDLLSNVNNIHPQLKEVETTLVDLECEILKSLRPEKSSYLLDRVIELKKKVNDRLRFQEVLIEIIPFKMLIKDLVILKNKNKNIFDSLFAKLITCSQATYYGTRYEIHIARVLIEKKIKFLQPDPPDFLLKFNQKDIFIECTSKHFEKEKDKKGIFKGMMKVINKKNKVPYDKSSLLAIDITNVIYNDIDIFSKKAGQDRLKFERVIDEKRFGSLLLSFYVYDELVGRYMNIYNRIDSKQIDPNLKQLLDIIWPNDKKIKTTFLSAVPKVG